MNPVIVIPTYWSSPDYIQPEELFGTYDHMTPIDEEGELGRCLKSLREVRGVCRIIIPVISEGLPEGQAAQKVQSICAQYPSLDIIVVGPAELNLIYKRLDQIGMSEYKEAVTNVGYGSVRNFGLLLAAILGHTEVVFIDDDEIITDPDFLIKALYGLGKLTKRGIPILAKTGYFLDRRGSWKAPEKDPWYNFGLKQSAAFNEWIEQAMEGPRLAPSNSAYGGCLAINYEAFKRVAFDPWITRGEDLDYMINLRMYGLDMWFDNQWSLRHLPPETTSESVRFRQDVYRWVYEHRKLEYLRSQIDLLQIRPRDLEPYPGPLVNSSITKKLAMTGVLRSVARPETGGYFRAAMQARRDAERYAQDHCAQYFRFQTVWPTLVEALTNDTGLANAISRGRERMHSGYTDQFSVISPAEVWEKETGEAGDIARRWAKGDVSGRTASRRAKRPTSRSSSSRGARSRGGEPRE